MRGKHESQSLSPQSLVTNHQSLIPSYQSLMQTHHADGSDDECHTEKLEEAEVLPEDGEGEENGGEWL